MNTLFKNKIVIFFVSMILIGASTTITFANHSWGNYHWARTINPFTLKVGDNVSSNWDPYLATTSIDWSLSTVLDTKVVVGASKGNCQPAKGRIEVCNKTYGNNGWLGIAQVWVNNSGHITQSTVKVNDTYFNTSTYNTPDWKNLVMCQEVGHALGLDHQDEIFSNTNLGTCMDYTNHPSTNQHPNQHDYDQLMAIYAHIDDTTTLSSTALPKGNGVEANLDEKATWGKSLRKDGRNKDSLFGLDLGHGEKLFTFVIWAE